MAKLILEFTDTKKEQAVLYCLSCAEFGAHLAQLLMWQKTILANVSPDWHNESIQQSIRWMPKQCKRWRPVTEQKGAGLAPLNSRKILNHLSLSCLTALLIQSSEYNTFFPLPLAQALLLQGKLNINLSIFVSTQQEADKILNCEKIHLWNS